MIQKENKATHCLFTVSFYYVIFASKIKNDETNIFILTYMDDFVEHEFCTAARHN
jgi:hypothetical protein